MTMPRIVNNIRVIPGAASMRKRIESVKNAREASKEYAEAMKVYEQNVKEYAEFKHIPVSEAEKMFKTPSTPKDMLDVIKLRRDVRLAIQFWDSIAMNPEALTTIAEVIAELVPNADKHVQRESVKAALQNDVEE
jgi:hypothetical protein